VPLVDGAHHVTFLTEDVERLKGFYARVFEAPTTLDMTEEGVRHVLVTLAPDVHLHPFQILAGPQLPPAPGTMFGRGRLDHFALRAPSREAFVEIWRRLEAEGALDGDVRDTGTMWILGYHDPDGFYAEVIWRKPGAEDADTLERGDWTTVQAEDGP
jgi:catechol 2,3-dioxygenase-like lactoylglutathione lyase family enzyme